MENSVTASQIDAIAGEAKISYCYFCTPFPPEEDAQKCWERVKDRARELYEKVWFDDNPEDVKSLSEFADIKTAQNFLHGGGLPFPCGRIFIDDFSLKHPFVNIKADNLMISCYPDKNVVQLSLNLTVTDILLSTLVYMRQIFCDNPVFELQRDVAEGSGNAVESRGNKGTGTWAAVTALSNVHDDGKVYVSVESTFRSVMKHLGMTTKDREQAFLCEINYLGDYGNVYEVEAAEGKAIYGLISGDEGWKFVPDEIIEDRLKHHWGSREFMRLYSFGSGSVLINLNHSDSYRRYLERQRSFGGAYYGGINPYFLLEPEIAGVAHGVFFSMETVMVIKTVVNRIYSKQEEFQSSKGHDFGSNLHKTREYRRDLIATLRMVENMGISELGELENMMLGSQEITPIIDRLKYLLDLLEAELNLLYSERTNHLVNILTILGLCLSALSMAAAWIALF